MNALTTDARSGSPDHPPDEEPPANLHAEISRRPIVWEWCGFGWQAYRLRADGRWHPIQKLTAYRAGSPEPSGRPA